MFTKTAPAAARHPATVKKAKTARTTKTTKAARTTEALEIVVRRGAARRFDALKKETSELPVVVTWDRREADRREKSNPSMEVPRNRRAADRRQKPPFTWDLADFVVVSPTRKGAAARKKQAKKR
jgi:hypothetical protein